MARSKIKAEFGCDVSKVWRLVTEVENYGWRSDLSQTERLSETKFIEYTKDGFATEFTVTAAEPCGRWEFDLDNENMSGHWTGLFYEGDGKTRVEFTEEVKAKKLLLRPFLKTYLVKQQSVFIADMERELSRQG